jgi:hypothetical protein
MGGFFEQTGGVRINPHAIGGSLANEFGLERGSDFKGDGHWQPLSGLPLPYGRPRFESSKSRAGEKTVVGCGRYITGGADPARRPRF